MTFKKDFIFFDTHHSSVEVTGSWCNWQQGVHHLTKIEGMYFITTVDLPFGEKVLYKYIVDGNWQTNPQEPTETGSDGLVNNVFQVPAESAVKPPVVGSTGSPDQEPTLVSNTASGADVLGQPSFIGGAATAAPAVSAVPIGTSTASKSADSSKPSYYGETTTPKPKDATGPYVVGKDQMDSAAATAGLAGSTATAHTAATSAHATTSGIAGTETNAALVPNGVTPPSGTTSAPAAAATTSASSSTGKAPLPASTADAPVAPGTKTQEGQGLFSAISHIASAATAAAAATAATVIHKLEDHPDTAPTGLTKTSSIPTASATSQEGSTGTKSPTAALEPIATNAGVSKVTKELAAVDLPHTKQEVTGIVDQIGGAISGALASIGAATNGAHNPNVDAFHKVNAKDAVPTAPTVGRASSALSTTTTASAPTGTLVGATPVAGATLSGAAGATAPAIGGTSTTPSSSAAHTAAGTSAPTLPPIKDGPQLYPENGASPVQVKITEPEKSASHAVAESQKDNATAPAASGASVTPSSTLGKKEGSSFTDKLKKRVSRSDKKDDDATKKSEAPAAAAAPAAGATTASSVKPATPVATGNGIGLTGDQSVTGQTGDRIPVGGVGDLDVNADKGLASASTAPGVTGSAAADASSKKTANATMHPTPATSASTANKKKESASGLGVGSAPAPPTAAPATPSKNGVSSSATPASNKTSDYKTAPSTPSTPSNADQRKRKSSFFQKVKQAFK